MVLFDARISYVVCRQKNGVLRYTIFEIRYTKMATVITVKNISKTFGTVKAVNELSFSLDAGICFGFLGPNGAGKTTVMKMIYGKCTRDKDNNGTMDIFGYDPMENELAIKYISGVVQQEDNLDEELNVIQNLMIYSRFYDMPVKTAKERIAYLLDFLELTEKAKSLIRELSGGMKRRLVIARALLNSPKLLILDEPTTGLDPQVRHLIWDKIRQLQKEQTTVLLTTHYMEEAYQLCDHILIMHKGRNIMQGTPDELLSGKIEKYVLEIFDIEDKTLDRQKIERPGIRVEHATNTLRYYCSEIDSLRILAGGLESDNYLIRQTNLEDVFLSATGRGLNDKQ
jgi:lipooligosaccharide transport system ATP-binding protein